MEQPWLAESLERLDLRRGDRVLVAPAAPMMHVTAVRRAVGRDGDVVVVEGDRRRAGAIAEQADVAVVAANPRADECYGVFDAFWSAPFAMPPWPAQRWGELARTNLRPGGRFAIDLPGAVPCDELMRCWREVAGDDATPGSLAGPDDAEFAAALREVGLRRVETALGTSLIRVEDARVFAAQVAEPLGADARAAEDLALMLMRRIGSSGAFELVVHRTRVGGMR